MHHFASSYHGLPGLPGLPGIMVFLVSWSSFHNTIINELCICQSAISYTSHSNAETSAIVANPEIIHHFVWAA
jgi:hypothetical protein